MSSSTIQTPAVTDDELRERFRPIFDRIAEGAVQREHERRLPFHEVQWLREARFGALRVPVGFGGFGATIRQLFDLLIDLAAAESNLPQALRVHWSFVEDQRLAGDERARHWLAAAADGTLVGNAITEPGVGAADRYRTTLTRKGGDWALDGIKYYSTGSLYADHILVAADRDGERVSVLVDARQEGVEQTDDWDGFGQRLTASGTTTFTGVVVPEDRILGPGYGAPGRTYATAYLQLVQLAVLAGIARRAEADAVDWVRARTRTFTHAVADLPRHDPLVQQVIGKLSAAAFGARAAVLAVADDLDVLLDAGADDPELLDRAEASAARAQSVVIGLVLDATAQLFEVGGASITSSEAALDRHWRNARTVAAHNPLIYKQQAVGAHVLNGDPLPYAWSAGRRPGVIA
ncbi:acyl-CoA dehydrogenase family protein [Rhodococcus aetherivorans]|uniref:acyl-CoA dehydrogenase family protein n=1 Tax=Rhodococcus TaxID=1827 RepID=UPI00045C924E|nr:MULTISPECIES: acyl-CoA dehydrogenase family protein [Rhodococcus]KDE11237.1 acyl-CoA dehydrogenase [Rhodococcus aetherivorans]PND50820.1 acyl-CoA dehydrogenase [Rhodococcus sp. ENV425]USC15225.1 acyl-CoA dehydrogenase family protein [Rhodococcus sp. 11-3]WFS11660.1 acyl-CoA dehydrogenase family protein [Rhodococcus aetherivorans]WKW98597.1 acyl-CoA dehydrogenase family protein [Rhodococcus aetherivorans]